MTQDILKKGWKNQKEKKGWKNGEFLWNVGVFIKGIYHKKTVIFGIRLFCWKYCYIVFPNVNHVFEMIVKFCVGWHFIKKWILKNVANIQKSRQKKNRAISKILYLFYESSYNIKFSLKIFVRPCKLRFI